MFRLARPDDVFPTACAIRRPDGRETLEAKCTLHFLCLETAEARKLALRGNAELLRKVLVGWDEGIEDEHGEPLAFTEANRDRLIGVPYVAACAVDAYFERFHLTKNF